MKNFLEHSLNVKKRSEEEKSRSRILPPTIRYALQYGEALVGKNEIKNLNDTDYFENEVLYLTIKGLEEKPEEQKILLERYLDYILNKTNIKEKDREVSRNIINESLKDLDSVSVKASKLAQLSRQGFDLWQEKFQKKAEELSEDKRNVFLVANSMFLGLGSFVDQFSKKNKALNIITPKWIDEGTHIIGYTISFENGKASVDFLLRSYDGDQAGTVFVDDTMKSGKLFAKIKDYWARNRMEEPDIITISERIV